MKERGAAGPDAEEAGVVGTEAGASGEAGVVRDGSPGDRRGPGAPASAPK